MARNNGAINWTGWVYFAAFLMIIRGILEGFFGLVALLKDTYYVVAADGLLVFDYGTWGWLHLLAGVVILWAGVALLSGSLLARLVGITMASVALLGNLAFINAFPLWSIFAIVIDIIIIYALTVHGDELAE